MFEAKRLHPIAIVLNALKIIKESFLPIVAVLIFQGARSSNYFELIFLGVYLVGSIVYGILDWFKFTYRVEDGEIRIDQGIFIKKKRYIRLERIQSIDITEGVLQRLFSLVKVTIDTAGSSKQQAEAVLTAIPKGEAELFQSLLKEAKEVKAVDHEVAETNEKPISVVEEEKILFKMSFKELFIMAATSGGVGIVFSGAMAIVGQFAEFIDFDKVYSRVEAMVTVASWLFIVLFIIAALLFAYAIATIGILLKYAYFTVKKTNKEIVITRGLLERRQFTISSNKIQAIRIVENLIRQPLGYATVYVETASGSITDNENAKVMLFPLIKKKHLKQFLEMVSDDYVVDVNMNPVPKRALRRYMIRECYWWLPVIAALIYFFRPLGFGSMILIFVGLLWGYLSYREAGWNITNQQLTLTYRALSKQTYVVRKQRIQSMKTRQSLFQKRVQLGTVSAFSKTGLGPSKGKVFDLAEEDVMFIRKWFQRKV
ncbi:PH domain-containing protein [Bacillus sp. JJ722]|uniref:PH domain-containing protein n=1 Tax=Bacillus sp. JJ722 TaxID=3122973 RepID=UPI002FFD8922